MPTKGHKGNSFPLDWPVDTSDPSQGLDQAILSPGALLYASSGSDISINKSASQKRNNPHTFLCLLPGNLQLQAPMRTNDGLSQSQSQEDPDESDLECHADDDLAKLSQDKPMSHAHAHSARLGYMNNFMTGPTFSINATQELSIASAASATASTSLQFLGQHVLTTSKFLLLAIQPKKKKQRVTVRQVFNSVVAFGDGKLLHHDHTTLHDSEASSEPPSQHQSHVWEHYGGSNRTKQSGFTGKWVKNDSVLLKRSPLDDMQSDGEDSSNLDSFEQAIAARPPQRASLSRQSKSKRTSLMNDSEAEDESCSAGSNESGSGDIETNPSASSDDDDAYGSASARRREFKGDKPPQRLANAKDKSAKLPAAKSKAGRSFASKDCRNSSSDSSANELDSDGESDESYGAVKKTQNGASKSKRAKLNASSSFIELGSDSESDESYLAPVKKSRTRTTKKTNPDASPIELGSGGESDESYDPHYMKSRTRATKKKDKLDASSSAIELDSSSESD